MACEGRASLSGVSCRVRRPIWQPTGYPAAPTHSPHVMYPRAPGRPNYQHRSEFFFQSRGYPEPLKYPHVRPQMGNFATSTLPRPLIISTYGTNNLVVLSSDLGPTHRAPVHLARRDLPGLSPIVRCIVAHSSLISPL